MSLSTQLMVMALNCARGEAQTLAALDFVSRSNPPYHLLLLQEPWLNRDRLPPRAGGFHLFQPVPLNPSALLTFVPQLIFGPRLFSSRGTPFWAFQFSVLIVF